MHSVTRNGHKRVVVKPPGAAFELVHDSHWHAAGGRTGSPLTLCAADTPASLIAHATPAGVAQCRPGIAPAVQECALFLKVDGARSALLLPDTRLAEAQRFTAQAAAFLRQHRAR